VHKTQSTKVSLCYHDSDGAGGETPRGLPENLGLVVLVLEGDLEHLAEVLTQIVRCRSL